MERYVNAIYNMRMKTHFLLAVAVAVSAYAQESEWMDVKGWTLPESRPDTPITNLPVTISEPGFYFLVTDLSLLTPGEDGITINADKVGIDCKGFSIMGPGERSGNGIMQNPTNRYCMIANGTLGNWQGDGKYAVYLAGIGDRVQNVRAIGNSKGILCGEGGRFISCVVQSNVMQQTGCGIYGYQYSLVSGCEVLDIRGQRYSYGIRVDSNSNVRECSVREIEGDGLCFGVYAGSACNVDKCDVRSCGGRDETGAGIRVMDTSNVRGCSVEGASHRGIWIADICRVENNTVEHSGATGICVDGPDSWVRFNTVVSNPCGIHVMSGGNLIVGNKAVGNGVAYAGVTNAGNKHGPITATVTNDPDANLEL